ncbi:hypothetical protein ACOSP7_004181 [Xanthoceras sorbifolium]
MDLRYTLLCHALMSVSFLYKDMLEAEGNEAERRELRDKLMKGEKFAHKDKSLEEEKVALQDDYPNLNLYFHGPAVGELIESFEEIRTTSAIEILEGDHEAQDENDG